MILIAEVLDRPMLDALREEAKALIFENGRATAGRHAREVKANLQARPGDELDAILGLVRDRLMANDLFRSVARPRHFARLLLSRYGPGMEYGLHVDDAIMQGSRTDLSFTLPLSEASDYVGGELVLEDALEERAFRVGAGDAIVYPTSALHRVAPVTRGERLAVVGWVSSWVRDPARREVLHDLDVAAHAVFEAGGKSPAFDRLLKAKSNLYRMWAEG